MAYLSASTICTILGIDYSDPVIEAEVDALVPVIEDLIDDHVGCTLTPQEGLSFFYNGTGIETLVLGRYLREITSCEIVDEDGVVQETLDVTVQPIETKIEAYKWLRVRSDVFPIGEANIKVTGNWGLSPTPHAINAAAAFILKNMFDMRKRDATVMSESSNSKSTMYDKDTMLIPPVSKAILAKYINRSYMV